MGSNVGLGCGFEVHGVCMVGLGLRRSAKGHLGIDISVAVP